MHLNPEIRRLLEGLNHPSLPGIDLSLARMQQLLEALGRPHETLPPVIHLAGTNGKGSTHAFLRAIYKAAGYKVHAYTSPHLVRFNERILLRNEEISDAALLPILTRVAEVARRIPVTFFEATTAAAFLAFAESRADIVLLETGLGGRLDATNVVARPALTILTPIDYDHMEFLGNSLEAIATEKAGILKPHVGCAVGVQLPQVLEVVQEKSDQLKAPLTVYGRDWQCHNTESGWVLLHRGHTYALPAPNLLGPHQYHNAALACVAALEGPLELPAKALSEGVQKALWPARLQQLSHGPLVDSWRKRGPVLLDGAHNESAARVLAGYMVNHTPITLVCGMMQRKDVASFLAPLVPYVSGLIAVPIPGEECHPPETIASVARALGVPQVDTAATPQDLAAALAAYPHGMLVIAGSLFLAGEVLKNHG